MKQEQIIVLKLITIIYKVGRTDDIIFNEGEQWHTELKHSD